MTTSVGTDSVDMAKQEAFGGRMVETMNAAAISLSISLGHRTGLFDVMSALRPSTPATIAEAAGLNERYVREWLGAMVTGRIIEFDPATGLYRLPAEHAAWLTRAASPNNIAASMQWFGVLGYVEDRIVEAFRHGRGVPYSAYNRFHEVMAEESHQTVVCGLTVHILPIVPGLAERLERGIEVLDVGCGSGRAMNHLAALYPRSTFHGYDASPEAIAVATDEAKKRGLMNAKFRVQDVAAFDEPERFDLVTAFDAIHDQAKPAAVLRNIHRTLRRDGVFLMQDIAGTSHLHEDCRHPLGALLYTISCMHCMSVSLANGGPGLGAMWGRETAVRMLGEAGFPSVRVETLPHDILNYYYVATPTAS